MTECLDQLRDNRSAINSAGIMDNSSVIARGERVERGWEGERERVVFGESLSRLGGGELGFESKLIALNAMIELSNESDVDG